jgi:hypothetical protein
VGAEASGVERRSAEGVWRSYSEAALDGNNNQRNWPVYSRNKFKASNKFVIRLFFGLTGRAVLELDLYRTFLIESQTLDISWQLSLLRDYSESAQEESMNEKKLKADLLESELSMSLLRSLVVRSFWSFESRRFCFHQRLLEF